MAGEISRRKIFSSIHDTPYTILNTVYCLSMAWIIVGLGNPGYEYEGTRHNTGRMAVGDFAKYAKFSEWREDKKAKALVSKGLVDRVVAALVLPNTFMNKSGNTVSKIVKNQKQALRTAVVYDDLDLPLGSFKTSFNRGG